MMVLYPFFLVFVKMLGLLIYLCPAFIKEALASLFAMSMFWGVRFRKKIILHNIALCFPRKSQESMQQFQKRCESIAYRNYKHYFLLILEIFERFHWTSKTVEKRVELVNFELLHRLREEKTGYFFLTAHLGNWELLTFVGVSQKVPLSIITRYLRNNFFDRLWVDSRKKYGLDLLDESGSGLAAIRAIRKQARAVGFIMDQHTGPPHGILYQFFGAPAWCPKGLAILSTKLNCPVIPAYLVRTGPGKYRATISEPLNFASVNAFVEKGHALDDHLIQSHIGICNQNMEQWVKLYPEQYLWLHRRFKQSFDYRSPLPWE